MVINSWATVIAQSFRDVWLGVIHFLPNFIVAVLVFVLAWVIGSILGKAIAQVLRNLRVDEALKGAGLESAVNRAGYKLDIGAFLGTLVKWFIVIVGLIASLDILGLDKVNEYLKGVLAFIPNVVVAVIILLVGAAVAEALEKIVVASARSASMRSAHFLGVVTRWAIWIFAGLAALSQLGIAATFLNTIVTGVMIGFALAFGLAFGLGGQEEARHILANLRKNISSHNDTHSHE